RASVRDHQGDDGVPSLPMPWTEGGDCRNGLERHRLQPEANAGDPRNPGTGPAAQAGLRGRARYPQPTSKVLHPAGPRELSHGLQGPPLRRPAAPYDAFGSKLVATPLMQ